jgi:hypothetical protein
MATHTAPLHLTERARKSAENRLRYAIQRLGFELRRCRARDRMKPGQGLYRIEDRRGAVAAGAHPHGYAFIPVRSSNA